MTRFTIPTRTRKANLPALRRVMLETMWLDYKLFGYTTETVKLLQQRIIREKEKQQAAKVIEFPTRQREKAA